MNFRKKNTSRELASKATTKLADRADQLLQRTPPPPRLAQNFYTGFADRLRKASNFLNNSSTAYLPDKVTELLECLEIVCIWPKKLPPLRSALQVRKFSNVETLVSFTARDDTTGLKTLAEGTQYRRSRKDILGILDDFLNNAAEAVDEHDDFNMELDALYETLAKYRTCLGDQKESPREALITQISLSIPHKKIEDQPVSLSLLFLAHLHTKQVTKVQTRIWRDARIDVFDWKGGGSTIQSSRATTPMTNPDTPSSGRPPTSRASRVTNRAFCQHISRGIMDHLLLLEIRGEKLMYRSTSFRETQ